LKGAIPEGLVVDHIDRDSSNNLIDNLRLVTGEVNARNSRMSVNNTSGITGVSRIVTRFGVAYWAASWNENGKSRLKHFSVALLGDDNARRRAIEHREEMIRQLNAAGAGYSATHGT
jgi:hypothetical protein